MNWHVRKDGIYDLSCDIVLDTVVGTDLAKSEVFARHMGFRRYSTEWASVIEDASIGIVAITMTNASHAEIAIAALQAGKHCYCEKPMAVSIRRAGEMVDVAERSGLVTQVGFNCIKNPALSLARQMIVEGELGSITSFMGLHAEDYLSDPPCHGHGVLPPMTAVH